MDFYLLVFKNTTDALKGEEELKQKKIEHAVYPTPPQILGSCGISLRFTKDELDVVSKLIEKEMNYKALYKLSKMSIIKIKEYDVN
ncbi:DUF3343 domain-containing protein [Proteiniclasticum sp.]|uniref:DUF3343 domain-containing protein n=1 Tax=Proteiniclasticum sp. TaxID=2053595 RepID=UPI0028993F59|nr:DUF3343 domain-containing protein [Proteiniclasticum sp.]